MALVSLSKSELAKKWVAAKDSLRRVRDKAEQIGMNAIQVGAGQGTCYGVGRLHGWADREGKSLDIPKTEVSATLVGGLVTAAIGVTGIAGKNISPWLMTIGGYTSGANLALTGYKHGSAPPD